jgi:hypothetical protein
VGYDAAVKAVLGDRVDTQRLFRNHLAAEHHRRLILAAHLVPGRWSPAIRIEGLDGLREALRRGRGAIVWCDQFIAQTIIGKRALFEAGIEAHQVSVNFHGFSESKFGLNVLNPPLVKVENRFLKSRIVFERADAYQVTARIQKTLKENGVALFAMSTLETTPFREYRAIVSPELKPGTGEPTSRPTGDMATKNLVLQAAYILSKRDRLLEALELQPEQMMAWSGASRLTELSDQPAVENGAS